MIIYQFGVKNNYNNNNNQIHVEKICQKNPNNVIVLFLQILNLFGTLIMVHVCVCVYVENFFFFSHYFDALNAFNSSSSSSSSSIFSLIIIDLKHNDGQKKTKIMMMKQNKTKMKCIKYT